MTSEGQIVEYKIIPYIHLTYVVFLVGLVLSLFRKSDGLLFIGISKELIALTSELLIIISFIGIFISYLSNLLYSITGTFTFNDKELSLKNADNDFLEMNWAEIEFASLRKLSGRFFELKFNNSNVFLKLNLEVEKKLRILLNDKGFH